MDLSIVQVQYSFFPKMMSYIFWPNLDINECELSLDDCDVNAACEDVIGSYNCTCNFGYDGNGTHCSKCKKMFAISFSERTTK